MRRFLIPSYVYVTANIGLALSSGLVLRLEAQNYSEDGLEDWVTMATAQVS